MNAIMVNVGEELVDRVLEAQSEAVNMDVSPTEVWLGPEEYKQFAAEAKETSKWRVYSRGDLHPELEPGEERFLGLRVRRMVEAGVRVGRTFSAVE